MIIKDSILSKKWKSPILPIKLANYLLPNYFSAFIKKGVIIFLLPIIEKVGIPKTSNWCDVKQLHLHVLFSWNDGFKVKIENVI